MLTAIPGVSRAVASAIVAQYPTLQSLLAVYRDVSRTDQAKRLALADILVGKNKLGPKKSERIFTVGSLC